MSLIEIDDNRWIESSDVSTVVVANASQPIGNVLQCRLPVHFAPCSALLEHGLGQALVAVKCFIRKTVAVCNPAFVDCLIFKRHDTHDLVILDLDNQIGACGIVRADRLAA